MARYRKASIGAALAIFGIGAGADSASGQALETSFFVLTEIPSWGADLPTLEVSDQNCYDAAYALGFGDRTWRAYLDGKAEEGEGQEVASDRIGPGPWHNPYGVVIAESVAQLHSDESELTQETAITNTGEYVDPSVLTIPPGSELSAAEFTRDGPYFCFATEPGG